jgi:hypothetical protein
MRSKPQITRIPQMVAGKGLTVGRGNNLYGTKACGGKLCAILSGSAKSA